MKKSSSLIAWIAGGIFVAGAAAAVIWDATRDHSATDRQAFGEQGQLVHSLENEQKALSQTIKRFSGSGECYADSECKVTGIGAKVCGKYREFIIYSVSDSNAPLMESALRQFNRNQEKLTNLSMAVPHCGVEMPQARCVRNRCVKVD